MGSSLSRRRSPSSALALKPERQSLERLLFKEERRPLELSFVNEKSSPFATNDVVSVFSQRGGEGQEATQPKSWMPFSQFSTVSSAGSQFYYNYSDYLDDLQLTGLYRIGPNSSLETVVQGTKVQVQEFRSTLLHKFGNLYQGKERKIWNVGQITICALTDFHLRHRLTLESILGSEEKGQTFSTVVSTDFEKSGISWGLAHSYRPYNKLTLFSRFNSDEYLGKRLLLQAVQKLNDRNTLSPLCAVTLGKQHQAGISWTHQFNSPTNDSFEVKVLCNNEGSFLMKVKARVGEV